MRSAGSTTWIIPGGRIPLASTGREPEFTSRDEIWILNSGEQPAAIDMMMYYEDQEPGGPYKLSIPARRVRCVRINDLIDPEAVMLERAYGVVVQASCEIVVQVARYDTRQAETAMSWSLAFPVEHDQPPTP